MSEDISIGYTQEDIEGIRANSGGGFHRVPFGDYRLKVTGGEIMPAKNSPKPHNMIKLKFEIVKAYDDANVDETGAELDGLYGTPQSPKYMQERFKAVLEACKVGVPKSGLKLSNLIGREFDASVVWELSDSKKLNEMGEKIYYVNPRVKAERPVGTARPKTVNPKIDSQKAARYVEGREPSSEKLPTAPEWERPAATETTPDVAPTYIPESEVDPAAHRYRALYRMGGSEAITAKAALVDAGIDPEGPVNVAHLADADRAAFEKLSKSAA